MKAVEIAKDLGEEDTESVFQILKFLSLRSDTSGERKELSPSNSFFPSI